MSIVAYLFWALVLIIGLPFFLAKLVGAWIGEQCRDRKDKDNEK